MLHGLYSTGCVMFCQTQLPFKFPRSLFTLVAVQQRDVCDFKSQPEKHCTTMLNHAVC